MSEHPDDRGIPYPQDDEKTEVLITTVDEAHTNEKDSPPVQPNYVDTLEWNIFGQVGKKQLIKENSELAAYCLSMNFSPSVNLFFATFQVLINTFGFDGDFSSLKTMPSATLARILMAKAAIVHKNKMNNSLEKVISALLHCDDPNCKEYAKKSNN